MTTPHRCICQHENPNSPYPAGYDGCTPEQRPRRLYRVEPDPAALPVAAVMSALELDSCNAQSRPPSMAALFAHDAQLAITASRSPHDALLGAYSSTRPVDNASKEH